MRIFHRFLLISLAFGLSVASPTPLLAQAPASSIAAPASASSTMDPAQALLGLNKQLDNIKTTLSGKGGKNAPLNDLRTQAGTVQQQAAQWVDALMPQMENLQARLTVLGPPPIKGAPPETPEVSQQRRQLERDKGKLDSAIKQAQLLNQDATKLTTEIAQARNVQFQTQLATRTDSVLSVTFWSDILRSFPEDKAHVAHISDLATDGIQSAWQVDNRLPFLLCLLGAVLLIAPGRWLLDYLSAKFVQRCVAQGHLRRSALAFLLTLSVTLSIGTAAWLVYQALNWNDTLDTDLARLARATVRAAFFSAFIAGLGRALLAYRHPSWRLPNLVEDTARALRWFPWLLGAAYFVLGVVEHLNSIAGSSLPISVFTRAVLALLISGLVGIALLRIERIRRHQLHLGIGTKHALWVGLLAGLAVSGVVVTWLAVFTGYIASAFFIAWQMLWIGMIVASLYILTHLLHDLFDTLLNPKGRSGHRLQATFNISPNALEQASIILSGASRVLLLLAAVGTVLMPFGSGPHDLFAHIGRVFSGLQVGELTIKPGAIFNAALVFALGLIVVRIIKRWTAEQFLPKTTLEKGMQSSVVKLLNYAALVIVIALALRTADVSLQSLTWIASALSFGIGFGLQAIVSNFISGLILLAEQPVKVGDWVSMQGVEGDIRRINARATEIQLWDRSTMIVPNSQFITQNLRNVTHGNALGRVKISLPMPLDTDAAKVREIILDALNTNIETLETPAPTVTLDDVTNTAMMFTGIAYVRSPRDASTVKSNLLFDILQRLAKAKLPLSTPQNMVVRNLGPLGDESPAAPG